MERDPIAAVVLLLVVKTAAWSIATGHYADPAPLPSAQWWYLCCSLFVCGDASIRHSRDVACGMYAASCGLAIALAALHAEAALHGNAAPVAAWYDFVQLVLASLFRLCTARSRG